MSYTLTIGSTVVHSGDSGVYVLEQPALTLNDSLSQGSTATFTLYDSTGTLFFPPLSRVLLVESVLGIAFSGYLLTDQKTNDYPSAAIRHSITCIDEDTYLTAKRVASGLHDDERMSGQYAGDNVVYLLANYLAQEGVTAAYAQATTSTQADFSTGTLTNVTAMTNTVDGDLELSPAGNAVSKTETTAAQWAANLSASGLDTTVNGSLQLASHATLQLQGVNGGNYGGSFGNAFAYQQIWAGTYIIVSGDTLQYSVWINSSSPQIMAAVDIIFTDGSDVRDSSAIDQNGIAAHPKTDLAGFANDQWYTRTLDLSSLAGKVTELADLGFEGDNAGTYIAYFRDITIVNGGTTKATIYKGATPHAAILQPNSNVKIAANGYSNVAVTPMIGYEQSGTRTTTTTSLTPAAIYKASLLSWTQTLAANTALAINTSIDGGATFQSATNFTPIPNLLPGASLVGRTLQTQQVLTLTGKDPTVTPVLNSIAWTIQPSYVATKHDTFKAYSTQTDFNTGTYTNTSGAAANLTINSSTRNWDNASTANQTLFGGASPVMGTFKKQGTLTTNSSASADATIRFDFAGQWADFEASIDIQVPINGCHLGLIYRTTGWQNNNDTYGYEVDFSVSTLNLGKGSNSSTGTGTRTQLANVTLTLNAGDWHTLTVVAVGSQHTISVDGVQYISITDATYTGAGYLGFRNFNAAASTVTGYFDNFGVMPVAAVSPNTPLPQWVSASLALGSITVGNSLIQWNATTPNGTILNVLASVNGGGYVACTNGAVIPGLGSGVVLTSGMLQLKVQVQTGQPSVVPSLQGLAVWVLSAYSSSGSRVSPGLNLSQVGRAGATLVNWNALVPSGASLFVDSSLDQKSWTQIGSGSQGSAPLAGIMGQADPLSDSFDSDTSSFYTATSQTNGTPATFVWDTALSRLEASGGVTALLLNSSVSTDDIDLTVLMDTSVGGGLCWRVLNTSNFYDLSMSDAASPTPNQAVLCKIVNNVRTTLGTYTTLNWIRNTPHLIRVSMIGAVITVSFDGATILTYTDNHPLGAGQVGVRTTTVSGQSSANFYSLRIVQLGDNVQGTVAYTRQRLLSTDPTVTPQLEDITVSVRGPAIQTGAFIPSVAYSVLNGSTNTIAQDLDDLAKQSNFWRKIKTDPQTGQKQLFFQSHQGTLAPFVLTGLDLHESWGISVKEDGTSYRTKPWVLGGTDTVLSTAETFPTDGLTTAFTVAYPIDSLVSIKAGSQSYTFGIQGVDTGRDFYYTPGNKTFSQDAAETPLPPGLLLSPVYYGQKNAVATAFSASLLATQAAIDGTSGLIEVAFTAPGLNLAATQQMASADLQQNGVWPRTLTGTTPRVGLAVGMLLPVFLPSFKLTDWLGLLTDMQTTFRTDTSRGGVVDAVPYFTLTAVSGPLLNAWSTTLSGR